MKIGWKLLLLSILVIFLNLAFLSPISANETKPLKIVNIVSLVRGKQKWIDNDRNWLADQIGLTSRQNLSSTWLIDNDALNDQSIQQELITLSADQEIGILVEVTESLADKLHLPYDRLATWSEPQNVFLSAYSTAQRRKIIDVLFNRFQEQFGYYPKSVGAWFIDSWSLQYMQKAYDIKTALLVAEQYATDHHTIRGHPWQISYYPSKNNVLIPGLGENKLDVAIVQWAAREPLRGYGYYSQHSNYSVQANDYTQMGMDLNYFTNLTSTYLGNNIEPLSQMTIGIEVGQEGARYFDQYKDLLNEVKNNENIQLTSLAAYADIFSQYHKSNSPVRFVDWYGEMQDSQWAGWVNTPNYRVGMIIKGKELHVRDFRIFSNDQDDSWRIADKRSELYRQTFALVDEVALGKTWKIIDNVEKTPPELAKADKSVVLDFGSFILEFQPEYILSSNELTNLPQGISQQITRNISRYLIDYQKELPKNKPANKWWQVPLLISIILISFKIRYLKKYEIIAYFIIIFFYASWLLVEVSYLTPINDLGITYFFKLPPTYLFSAVLCYFLIPLILSFLGICFYQYAKSKNISFLTPLVILMLWFFQSNFGWLFPLYRNLPLNQNLITGTKMNTPSFIFFFKFPSLAKLSYAFSEGQMNIDTIENLVSHANTNFLFLLVPILIFIVVNYGFLCLGFIYLAQKKWQKKQIFSMVIIFFIAFLTPLAINTIDVRLPTIFDVTLICIGVMGIIDLLTYLRKYKYSLYKFLLILMVINLLPSMVGYFSYYRKNLFFRSETNWSDRKIVSDKISNLPKLTDIYLVVEKPQLSEFTIFIPFEIEDHLFVDKQMIKKNNQVTLENGYALLVSPAGYK